MEGIDSHELKLQEKKAEEELSKLPEIERNVLRPALDLQKQRNDLFLQFLAELRTLEYNYDQQYAPLYNERSNLTKNTPTFWLKVLKNSPMISTMIFDQDEELLKYLVDIRHIGEQNSDNFTLEFYFNDNPFIENAILTKKYLMNANDEPVKGEGTEIKWKGANLTQKVKKTKKKGKNKKAGIKVEEVPSFFTFFKTITEDDEPDDSEEEGEDPKDLLEDDYELACEFRDELIPNAVYYYLGVAEGSDDEEEEVGEDGKKKPKQVDGSGVEKADCKPQ